MTSQGKLAVLICGLIQGESQYWAVGKNLVARCHRTVLVRRTADAEVRRRSPRGDHDMATIPVYSAYCAGDDALQPGVLI